MGIDKRDYRKFVTNDLITDQYYTNRDVSIECIKKLFEIFHLKNEENIFFIELSAGDGSFSDYITNCLAFDIEPKKNYIIKVEDSLLLDVAKFSIPWNKLICSIGNPPFGRTASLAIKFFNKSAEFADIIAFIVPLTFRKTSLVNKLNRQFHKIFDQTLKTNSFTLNEKKWSVKCAFQIWIKKRRMRNLHHQKNTSDFFFLVGQNEDPDFAIRRVGFSAGLLFDEDLLKLSEQNNFFIRVKNPLHYSIIKECFRSCAKFWRKNKIHNTAAVQSLSRDEMITAVDRHIRKTLGSTK